MRAIKTFGMNAVRLHQKINPDRWYYHADRLGVVVLQDAVQHFEYPAQGGAPINTTLFTSDWARAISGRYSHPSIIQWNIFNEGEYESEKWNASDILRLTRELDGTRLVDFNSGGPGNKLGIGDVNDVHSYPQPSHPMPSLTQYAEVGEYGGIGWNPTGHEWYKGQCHKRAITANNSADGTDHLLTMLSALTRQKAANTLSAAVYTQLSDVELECDGMFAYDRTSHFSDADTRRIYDANRILTREKEAGDEGTDAVSPQPQPSPSFSPSQLAPPPVSGVTFSYA